VRPGRDADPSPPSSAEVKNRAFVAYERVKPTKFIQMKPKSYGILRVEADISPKRRQLFTIRRITISPKKNGPSKAGLS